MLVGDDVHNIFAFINGKVVTFLVQNLPIISAYLLSHPSPTTPPPTLLDNHPSFLCKGKPLISFDNCLSVLLSVHLNV